MTDDNSRYTVPPPTSHLEYPTECPTCGGDGRRDDDGPAVVTCATCDGDGIVGRQEDDTDTDD